MIAGMSRPIPPRALRRNRLAIAVFGSVSSRLLEWGILSFRTVCTRWFRQAQPEPSDAAYRQAGRMVLNEPARFILILA